MCTSLHRIGTSGRGAALEAHEPDVQTKCITVWPRAGAGIEVACAGVHAFCTPSRRRGRGHDPVSTEDQQIELDVTSESIRKN